MTEKLKKISQKTKSFLFENRGVRQTVTKNIFWLSVSQLGSRMIRAAIIIYAARILGAAEYGVFSYVLGLAAFFTIFADISIIQIMTREAAKRPEERSYYFATSFWIKIFLLAGTVILVIFAAPHFSKIEQAKAIIPFVAFLVVFDGLRDFTQAFFRAVERMEWEAFVTMITNTVIAVSGFVILSFSATAEALTFTYITSTGAGAIVAMIMLRGEYKKIFSHFDKSKVKPILSSALPMAFAGLLGTFMLNTDMVMLGWWRTAQEIGFYSAGQKIIQVLYTLPAILASAAFPALSRLIGQKDNPKIRLLMEKMTGLTYLIAFPLALGGVILAQSIIVFVYGSDYAPATMTFAILSVTTLLVFPSAQLSNAVLAYDKQKDIIGYLALGALANVGFNTLLIPKFGISGSAMATLISQLLYVSLIWAVVKKANHFSTIRHLGKIFIAAIVMGGVSFILNSLNINVLVNIILSTLIYLGMLVFLRERLVGETIAAFKNN